MAGMGVVFSATSLGKRSVWQVQQCSSQNDSPQLRVVLTRSGGINGFSLYDRFGNPLDPLWKTGWQSQLIEPANFHKSDSAREFFGNGVDSRLLCGIDSPTCWPVFGVSELHELGGVHGEVNTVLWEQLGFDRLINTLSTQAILPLTRWRVNRNFSFVPGMPVMHVRSTFQNLLTPNLVADAVSPLNDWRQSRQVTYAEHIDLGAPFVPGAKVFLPPGTIGQTFPEDGFFPPREGLDLQRLARDQEFTYPLAPTVGDSKIDLSVFPTEPESDYAAMVMPQDRKHGWFVAVNQKMGILFGCLWPRKLYPFLGEWRENLARYWRPWAPDGRTPAEKVIGWEFARCPWPWRLENSVKMRSFHDEPTFALVDPGDNYHTKYWMFASHLLPGEDIESITDVMLSPDETAITLSGRANGKDFSGRGLYITREN
jgi:hypothetical protein